MRHPRALIHTERYDLDDYGANSSYVNEIAKVIAVKCRLSAGWTIEAVINEAYYQSRVLLLDFSPQIYFDIDYYNEAVKRMPLNVANAVFSVVYILLRETECMNDVLIMIENKLANRPVFNALRSMRRSEALVSFYPDTEYFRNSDFVNWKLITEGFRPDCIWRILYISKDYEFHSFVARGILGQLKAYALEKGKTKDEVITESEHMLISCIDDTLLWSLCLGDSATESMGYGFPIALVETHNQDSPETLEELKTTKKTLEDYRKTCEEMKDKIAHVEAEREAQFRASEEYKNTIEEMKQQLGRSHISFNTIADCILRLPTLDMQYAAFEQINSLLTGTQWSEKAQEILEKMFSKFQDQSNTTVNVSIDTFINNGTFNDNTNISTPASLPSEPVKRLAK